MSTPQDSVPETAAAPQSKGTLPFGEPHPSGWDALQWIRGHGRADLMTWQESFASTALSGNWAAEVCGETLRRILGCEPVSDRYALGLAWAMRGTADERVANMFRPHSEAFPVGMRVRATRDFAGVPAGTHGVVDEDYGTGFMVAWDLPDNPLPQGWVYAGQPAAMPGMPLRDGFDKQRDAQFLLPAYVRT